MKDPIIRHLMVSLFLLLAGFGLIRAFYVGAQDEQTTILAETIVVETLPEPYAHVKNEYECPEDKCVYGKLNEEVVQDIQAEVLTDRDIARRERKVICHNTYQAMKDKVINHDLIVERCATMMSLQYAFESGHGKSRKCVNQKNCFGIKNNRRDRCIHSDNGFCTYSAHIEGMRDYAELYMKHYEGYKSIKAFLDVYSPDGNGAYPQFVKNRYDETLQYFINN